MPTVGPDLYRDFAEFYDLYVGSFADDLPVYLAYARRARSPIIEVGAGSGRLTVPLARAGHEVVAVDISRAMLARLAARLAREPAAVRRRIRVVRADAARLSLRMRSNLIVVPFYTFNYFISARLREAALRRLAAHLSDGGRLLIDVFIPLARIACCPSEPVLKLDTRDPSSGARLRGWNRYVIDAERQVETRHHTFTLEGQDGVAQRRTFVTRRRYWHATQLRAMFARHGFDVEDVFDGYGGRRATSDAEQLLWVLRRPLSGRRRPSRPRGRRRGSGA